MFGSYPQRRLNKANQYLNHFNDGVDFLGIIHTGNGNPPPDSALGLGTACE